jgi:hypothetical protein
VVNSAKGRVKDLNMRVRPQVALVIQDPSTDYRYVQIRGRVVGIVEDTELQIIDQLCVKYRNRHWKQVEGEIRITYTILPESVFVDD